MSATDDVTRLLRNHYAATFAEHGPTVQGVDWGTDDARAELRHEKMAVLFDQSAGARPTVLDVGCGYGAFLGFLIARDAEVDYTGIDTVQAMVDHAAESFPAATFVCGDFLQTDLGLFDYVVCNGVLTQKLTATDAQMADYANRLIRKMFDSCNRGVAFNVMSTAANFMADNLYYRDPAELVAWALANVTRRIKLDHLYAPLYELTLYLYRDER
jgi:SAM-dependent methyltransferase